MSNQSHGAAVWREPAASGGSPIVTPAYLQKSGANLIVSTTGPAQVALYDVTGSLDYKAIDLTIAIYIVSNGSGGLTVNTTGPAFGVIADDGVGGLQWTTDLTRPPIADLRYDLDGNIWTIRRTDVPLRIVDARGHRRFY